MKSLKEKAHASPYGNDGVQLGIESYRPNSATLNENLTDSIIVSGLSPGTKVWMLKAYLLSQLEMKCDDPQIMNNGASAIVKLHTEAGNENNFYYTVVLKHKMDI